MSSLDGSHLARDAFGIIIERISGRDAHVLSERLAAVGLSVVVIEQERIAPLFRIERVDEVAFDGVELTVKRHGRDRAKFSANAVSHICAGAIQHPRVKKHIETKESIRRNTMSGLPIPVFEPVEVIQADTDIDIAIEIGTAGVRYRWDILRVALLSGARGESYRRGIERLRQAAGNLVDVPDAVWSVGFREIVQGCKVPLYPSLNAFDEEIKWMRLVQSQPDVFLR